MIHLYIFINKENVYLHACVVPFSVHNYLSKSNYSLIPMELGTLEWNINIITCFLSPKFDFVLFTNASLSGWGASLSSGDFISGSWSVIDSKLHINLLELKAVYLALSHFIAVLEGKSISIRCDNSTSIAYINKLGGTQARR